MIVIPVGSLVAAIMYIVGTIYISVHLSILRVVNRPDGQIFLTKNKQKPCGQPEVGVPRGTDLAVQNFLVFLFQMARSSTLTSPLPIPAAAQLPHSMFGFQATCVIPVSSSKIVEKGKASLTFLAVLGALVISKLSTLYPSVNLLKPSLGSLMTALGSENSLVPSSPLLSLFFSTHSCRNHICWYCAHLVLIPLRIGFVASTLPSVLPIKTEACTFPAPIHET